MSSTEFRPAIEGLPSNLREDLNGYVRAVEESLPGILSDINIPQSEWQKLYKVVPFVAGIRRLYGIINGQYWMMQDALEFAERGNFKGFAYGRFYVSPESEEYLRAKELNNVFFKWLTDNDIVQVVSAPKLSDAIEQLRRMR